MRTEGHGDRELVLQLQDRVLVPGTGKTVAPREQQILGRDSATAVEMALIARPEAALEILQRVRKSSPGPSDKSQAELGAARCLARLGRSREAAERKH